MKQLKYVFAAILIILAGSALAAVPQQINYQGYLTDTSGSPLDTTVAMTFKLYTDSTAGTLLWTEIRPSVNVTDGLFNVRLGQVATLPDSVLNRSQVWLGIAVGGDPEMTPRTRMVSVGYSYRVGTVDGASGGTIPGDVTIAGKTNFGFGNLNSGNYAFVTGRNDTASANYTTVSGGRYNTASDQYATVSGGESNHANTDLATVGGGYSNQAVGIAATIAGGWNNDTGADYATVGGGSSNHADTTVATVGGGYSNQANGYATTIAGGYDNTASTDYATVSGGWGNAAIGAYATVGGGNGNEADTLYATVGGGYQNAVSNEGATVSGGGNNSASGIYSVVAGGGGDGSAESNSASGEYSAVSGGTRNVAGGTYATVAGGYDNEATGFGATISGGFSSSATETYATVVGGYQNTASGWCSTVGGGSANSASGNYSFAAGRRARAGNDGCFVWADSYDSNFVSTDVNQFRVRASGGTWIYSNTALTSGVRLSPGSSVWMSASDSTLKRDLRLVDTKLILDKVSQLPIKQWSYKSQDPSIEHIGPMAQDFWKLFHVGDDSLTISTIDPSGIALAAIQELHKENEQLREEVSELRSLVLKLAAQQPDGNNATQAESAMFVPSVPEQNVRETQ
jgi:hypothetical protein